MPPPTPRSVKVRAVRALLYLFTDLPEQLLRKRHANGVRLLPAALLLES